MSFGSSGVRTWFRPRPLAPPMTDEERLWWKGERRRVFWQYFRRAGLPQGGGLWLAAIIEKPAAWTHLPWTWYNLAISALCLGSAFISPALMARSREIEVQKIRVRRLREGLLADESMADDESAVPAVMD